MIESVIPEMALSGLKRGCHHSQFLRSRHVCRAVFVLHFFAFFALTAALVVQLVLMRNLHDIEVARRIQRADRMYGIFALLLLLAGFCRVIWFEKGAEYYFNNDFFLIKIGLFVVVGLISIYPTVSYFRWNKWLTQDQPPEVTDKQQAQLRRCLHTQLVVIIAIILCASLMTKGYGM